MQSGTITTAGNHRGAAVTVTVAAMACEGIAAPVINAFTANRSQVQAVRNMADTVRMEIQNA